MSRSNPSLNAVHPCQRWHEWNGEKGSIRYYDKEADKGDGTKGKNIEVASPFTFLVLDKLATIKGWHDASDSGIYSNEVRDTTREPFVVKTFGSGPIATGFYREIKDRVGAIGGYFCTNLYVGYKTVNGLAMGSLNLHGAALNAWVEFEKKNRAQIDNMAITITGFGEGKKGKIVYRYPVFSIKEVSAQTNEQAIALDRELQKYLEGYFKKSVRETAPIDPAPEAEYTPPPPPEMEAEAAPEPDNTDDVPF